MTQLHINPNPDQPHAWGDAETPFAQIGGEIEVRNLVDAFYRRIELETPHVRAMYPDDLTEPREKLFEFLVGWLGGPPLYMEKRGHPRLRARHMPFPIDQRAVDDWMAAMTAAIDECRIAGPLREFLLARLGHTAQFMQNR